MKNTKTIVIYTNHYFPEQFKLNEITEEMVRQGYRVKVISQTPNYPAGSFFAGYSWFKRRKETLNEHLTVVRLPVIPRGTSSLGMMLNYASYIVSSFFYSLLTRDKADQVLVYCTSPIFIAWAGLRFAKRRNLPVGLYLMDLWPGNLFAMFSIKKKWLRDLIERMCQRIYQRFDTIFVSSYLFKEVLVAYDVAQSRIHYLPQHAEFGVKSWQKPKDDGILKVIFTGNIGQAQNLDILVEAAQTLKARGEQGVHFTLLGDGRYKETLIAKVKEEQVASYFSFLDAVEREAVPTYLAQHDLAFVSLKADPIISRTLPAKVQSYMAAGIPILASGEGETKRVIEEAGCGVCALVDDSADLVEALFSLKTKSEEKLALMGENGYNYCRTHYDLSRLTSELLKKLSKGDEYV